MSRQGQAQIGNGPLQPRQFGRRTIGTEKNFNAKAQRRERSGASADRRKLKGKMAALCRDAATKSFQRDDPEGNGDGAARSEFRLQPGRVNAELPTQSRQTPEAGADKKWKLASAAVLVRIRAPP